MINEVDYWFWVLMAYFERQTVELETIKDSQWVISQVKDQSSASTNPLLFNTNKSKRAVKLIRSLINLLLITQLLVLATEKHSAWK